MKKLLLLLCMMLSITMLFAQQKKRVAIVEVIDREGKLEYTEKLMLRSNLARAVTNIDGFEAYNRTDIDAVLNEHGFQRSGNVSDSDIKRIGEMTGAAYILAAEGSLTRDGKIFVTAQIINVETGLIDMTDNKLMGTSSEEMLRGCRTLASNMFGALAGVSTSASKFLNLFKAKPKSAEKQAQDSIVAAKKAEQAAMAAAAKEQQRLEAERIQAERAAAEKKAREDREAAEEQARAERLAAEQRAREERAAAEQKARAEREAAELAALERKKAAEEAEKRVKEERAAAELVALERKRIAEEQKAKEEAERAKHSITKVSNDEYRLETTNMDRKAYEQFIHANCPEAWQKHIKAKNTIITGWTFLGVGVILCSAWGMLPLADYYVSNQDKTYYITKSTSEDWYLTGIVAGSIGAALAFTSIPLLSAGYSIKNNTYKTYNKSCVTTNTLSLSLNLQASPNGLGLALQF